MKTQLNITRLLVTLLLALVLLFQPGAALAVPVVDIIFTATSGTGTTGGASIEAAPGDTLTVTIRLTADAAGISSYSLSLEFDTDLMNELDFISATEFLPPEFDFHLAAGITSQESTGALKGNVLTFDAGIFGDGPVGFTFAIGTVDFLVTGNVATDSTDIFSGFFNTGIDLANDNNNAPLSPTFNTASVNEVSPCGNNMLDAGEQCDDGNTMNGDCCSATCTFEASGLSCDDGDACNGAEL